MTVVPSLSLAEARHDVRLKARALGRAELALENTRGCALFVHPKFIEGCVRCEAWARADARVRAAERALEAAGNRLLAVESQQRERAQIGGER